MTSQNPTKVSQAAREAIVPALPKSSFKTFVFGPYLTTDTVVPRPTSDPSSHDGLLEHAKYLRYASKTAITAGGFVADFGESEHVMDFWSAHLGSKETATVELHHAYRSCGAIVVFASSVGSFCEMGLFSNYVAITQKMLILVHDSYKNSSSFFTNGILELFEQNNGKREFVNFSDHEQCVQIVMKFITGKYTKILREELVLEEADRIKKERPRG